jgi:hypothetical protein
MKAYFIIRDYFDQALKAKSARIVLKSYKIDGKETLTPDFIIDTQKGNGEAPAKFYYYSLASEDGSAVTLDINNPNTYNPFANDFNLEYPTVNGSKRGLPTGTKSGLDYGEGVMKFGVDVPEVVTGNLQTEKGAFFLDVDFEQSLNVEFDIVGSIFNSSPFEEPMLLRKYNIDYDREKVITSFGYYDYIGQTHYFDNGFGFLSGKTKTIVLAPGVTPPNDPNPHIDLSGITPIVQDTCQDKERTRSFAMFVNVPTPEVEYAGIKECCYNATVLAQLIGNDYEKNDFTGVFHKKQLPNETAKFFLVKLDENEEIELNNNDLGVFKDFGTIQDNPELKTFVLHWKKVLNGYGEGNYTIVKRTRIAGIDFEESDINYTLYSWSVTRADKTVRIDAATNGYMERIKTDFVNSGFSTSIRFGGFFGRREPKYEEDNIIYTNFISEQISMQQTNDYTLQSNLLPSCITQPIIDFMLFANDIFLNDYNLNNHLRNIIKFPVKFAENKGTSYFSTTTKAQLNLTFTEKKVDNIKRNY